MKTDLEKLKAKGRTPRPKRQLGAWQSFEVTAYSKVKQALSASMARLTLPSSQDLKLVMESKELVDNFEKSVNKFNKEEWLNFKDLIENSDLSYFDKIE